MIQYTAYLPVAQLDSASDSDSEGRRFESCRVGQKNNRYPLWVAVVFSVRQDSKDERYRATFRWTVATVSDQGEVTPSRDRILSGRLTLG